jgi:phosphoribosylanthranilate isomerase
LNLPAQIIKVAVLVDENFEDIIQICNDYKIGTVQLHGGESSDFCKGLRDSGLKVIKAFGIDESFDFEKTYAYTDAVDYFLFDTKSQSIGGSGKYFDWGLLKGYQLNIPYFLSGGIGLENIDPIKLIDDDRLVAIDVNSRFEIKPGLKDVEAVTILINKVRDEF